MSEPSDDHQASLERLEADVVTLARVLDQFEQLGLAERQAMVEAVGDLADGGPSADPVVDQT